MELLAFCADQISTLMTSELASYFTCHYFAYCSQLWAPQVVNLILDIERIQRRATKIIVFAVYRSHVSYEQRPLQRQKLLLRSGVRIQTFK